MKRIIILTLIAAVTLSSVLRHPSPAYADAPKLSSLYLEELTWQEVNTAIQSGYTTVIIPTGSTEENGPQLVLGTHSSIVRYTAGEIARGVGNTLVAPVIPYSPAGRISPPEGHMLFAGTVSLSDNTYSQMLEEIIRSLKHHGFRRICLIGDHKGSQLVQWKLAEKLTNDWKPDRVQVLDVTDYFLRNGQEEWNEVNGKVPDPKAHGGHIETSEMLAVDTTGVRDSLRGAHSEHDYKFTGAEGDSSQASANYGHKFLGLKIEAAIKQIQDAASKTK